MTPELGAALADLAEARLAHLRARIDAVAERIAAGSSLVLPDGDGLEAAGAYRDAGTAAASAMSEALDRELGEELAQLRALGQALDWLSESTLDRSLSARLADEGTTADQRAAELAGLLGVARGEAALLAGRRPPEVDRVGSVAALAHARLGRMALRVRRWLAEPEAGA